MAKLYFILNFEEQFSILGGECANNDFLWGVEELKSRLYCVNSFSLSDSNGLLG